MNYRLSVRVAMMLTALWLVGTSLPALRADEPTTGAAETLRWKLKKGQKFKVQLGQEMKQVLDMGAGQQEMPMRFAMYMSWNVDEATESEYTVTQTIDRITMGMSLPGMGEVEYDSASEEEPEGFAQSFAGSLSPLIGVKIVQTINGRGQSVKCEIDAEALAKLESGNMGAQFASEDMLKNMIAQSACVFPEEDIQKGANWEDQFSVKNQFGEMITKAKYTYDGNEQVDGKSVEKISVVSEVAMEPSGESPVEVEITKQDNKGTVYFDNAAGYVSSATMNQTMTMVIQAMGQEINVDSVGAVTFSIKPDDGSAPEKPID